VTPNEDNSHGEHDTRRRHGGLRDDCNCLFDIELDRMPCALSVSVAEKRRSIASGPDDVLSLECNRRAPCDRQSGLFGSARGQNPLPARGVSVGSGMAVGSGPGSRAGNVDDFDDLDGRGTNHRRVVPAPVPFDGDERASAEPEGRSCDYRDHDCPSHRRISYTQGSVGICST